jgi:hypothetical protein
MQTIEIARQSLRILWTNKSLWFFGLFVSTAGGTGFSTGKAQSHAPGAASGVSTFLVVTISVAALLCLASLVMHIVSEAALIDGVRHAGRGERMGIRSGVRAGGRHFLRLLGVKLGFIGTAAVTGVAVVAPVLVGALHMVPLWLGVGATVILALVGIPWILTVKFAYEYTMRYVVLEGRPACEAARHAWRFLHGRLVTSLKLMLLSYVGQMGGGIAGVVALVPATLVGVAIYFSAGLIPALVGGGLLALPCLIPIVGATGAFRSSVWTLGFLREHEAS